MEIHKPANAAEIDLVLDADNRIYMAKAFKSLDDDSLSLALAARCAMLRELQQTR